MPFQSVAGEMHRFRAGDLHAGKGGPVVKNRAQAVAIALSEERRAKGKKRRPSPHMQADALEGK